MKAVILFLLSITVALGQEVRTENVGSFSKIKVNGALDVQLVESNQENVVIEGNKRLVSSVTVEVDGDQLIVRKSSTWPNVGKLMVTIHYKSIDELYASGASDVGSKGVIKADKFALRADGASDVTVGLEARSVDLNISGASDLTIVGSVRLFKINASGASDLYAADFKAKAIEVDCSGATDIRIWAEEVVTGTSSGASSVYYKGDPDIRVESSGSSSIHVL